ncbi:unnamed protein product [Moneuplotes crassus]|uniref:Uncharacterized protein n=1 Tax=Euplotes crassus TaxID=5936 RepID=A0AAD2D548_EUPCR|nr:unnamed protein product [Moneuplotes crassus]
MYREGNANFYNNPMKSGKDNFDLTCYIKVGFSMYLIVTLWIIGFLTTGESCGDSIPEFISEYLWVKGAHLIPFTLFIMLLTNLDILTAWQGKFTNLIFAIYMMTWICKALKLFLFTSESGIENNCYEVDWWIWISHVMLLLEAAVYVYSLK